MENVQTNEARKAQLKQKALPYLPKNLESVEAQKTVLKMLAGVIPSVKVCIDKADRDIWPKVTSREMTLKSAAGTCAYEVNRILGITKVENLNLAQQSQTELMKAWIVLDYYTYILKSDYSVNIRKLQDHMTGILMNVQAPKKPEDNFRTVAIQTEPVKKQPAQPVKPVQNNVQKPPVQPVSKDTTPKKKKGAGASFVVIAAVVIFLLMLSPMFNKVAEVEQAIDEIGIVSMESQERIEAAEALYEGLSNNQKADVENYDVLTAARTEYDRLSKKVQDASDAIDAIGEVTLESGDQIKKAREAYDALAEDNLTSYVSDKEYILTRAERVYEECVIDDMYNSAVELSEKGKHEKAVDAFEKLIQDYPSCNKVAASKEGARDSLVALADEAFKSNKMQETVKWLDAVAEKYEKNTAYYDILNKVETKLNNVRPTNARTFMDKVGWGWGKIEVTAGDTDVYVKIEHVDDPSKYMVFYVRAHSVAEVKVKDGTYKIKYTTGKYWYSQDELFGADAEYCQLNGTYAFTTSYSGSYVYYYHADIDLSSSSTKSTVIDADDF